MIRRLQYLSACLPSGALPSRHYAVASSHGFARSTDLERDPAVEILPCSAYLLCARFEGILFGVGEERLVFQALRSYSASRTSNDVSDS